KTMPKTSTAVVKISPPMSQLSPFFIMNPSKETQPRDRKRSLSLQRTPRASTSKGQICLDLFAILERFVTVD
ncbi:MAG: hypothetical protein AAFQ74_09930, partial [Cyanobacteria bacterium J06623_4]